MLLEFLAAHEVSGLAARLVKRFFGPACGRSRENVRNAELVTQNPDPFHAEGMEQERTKTAKRFIDPKYDSTLKTRGSAQDNSVVQPFAGWRLLDDPLPASNPRVLFNPRLA